MSRKWFGGSSKPKAAPAPPPTPAPPVKHEETRKVMETANEESIASRKRIPPGRKSNLFAGIQKALNERLG